MQQNVIAFCTFDIQKDAFKSLRVKSQQAASLLRNFLWYLHCDLLENRKYQEMYFAMEISMGNNCSAFG